MSFSRSLLLFAAATILASCGEIREDLGLGRNKPDEFAVVERPPLSVPPHFELRPPRPGAPRPQEKDTVRQASEAIFGDDASTGTVVKSEAETSLLGAIGTDKATPDIRDLVNRESAQKTAASPHLVERLMNWENGSATTVDAIAEAERIKKAKANNDPINAGATPVIEKKTKGWLGL